MDYYFSKSIIYRHIIYNLKMATTLQFSEIGGAPAAAPVAAAVNAPAAAPAASAGGAAAMKGGAGSPYKGGKRRSARKMKGCGNKKKGGKSRKNRKSRGKK